MAFSKKKRKIRTVDDAAAKLDLPPDSYSSCPLIEICGSEVFISGCGSLLEYGDDVISLESGYGIVRVKGSGLTVSGFSDGHMTLRGTVHSVTIGESDGGIDDGRHS